MGEIQDITNKIRKFRDERDWARFHNHKDMAISLHLEATEVLEHFQWKTPDQVLEHAEKCKEDIADELADVTMNVFELADNLGINLASAIDAKLIKNAKKYPVQKTK